MSLDYLNMQSNPFAFINPYSVNCDYSLGTITGSVVSIFTMGAASGWFSSTDSSSEGGSSNKLASIEQDMQAQIKILNKDGGSSFTLYNLPTAEPPVEALYDTKITEAATAINTKKTEITTLSQEIDELKGAKAIEKPTKEAYTKDGVLNQTEYDNAYNAYLEQQRQIKAKEAELEKMEKSITEEGELGKALKAAKEAKAARADEIHAAYAKLNQLKLDRQAEIDKNGDNVIDAGDGNGTSRLLSPNKRKVHEFLEAKKAYDKIKKPTKEDYKKLETAYNLLPRDSKRESTKTAVQYADEYFKNIKKPEE